MLATIRDDTWNVLNMQHITPNSKRWDYSDIPGVGHKKIKGPAHIAEDGHRLRIALNPHPRRISEESGILTDLGQCVWYADTDGRQFVVFPRVTMGDGTGLCHAVTWEKQYRTRGLLTSWHGAAIVITGPLWGESAGYRLIHIKRIQWFEALMLT